MNLIVLPSVDSTNNYLQDLCNNNQVPDGTMVVSMEQTQGRGQRGNNWRSLPGDGLYASILLLPPNFSVEKQYLLNKAIASATARYIESKITEDVKIKWPNDILIQRRKIAGILIENNLRGSLISSSIVGIGINLNQLQFDMDFETPATSLRIESGKRYLPETEAKLLFNCVWSDYQSLLNGNKEEINTNYREHLFGLGSISSFKNTNESFKASLLDVNDEGAAILEVDGKVIQVKHPNTRIVV